MATVKKVSKAQTGKTVKYNELEKRLMQAEKKDSINQRKSYTNQRANKVIGKNKTGGTTKAKNGKSFPDLNKDGKITKADILKGRGVIAKKGMKVKRAQNGKTTPFQDYVKKYPGSGSDTLTSRNFDPRYNATDDGYFGSKAKQNKDLKNAYSKTYAKKEMTGVSQKDQKKYRIQKTGGKTTASMMKKGGKMTKTCKYGCK